MLGLAAGRLRSVPGLGARVRARRWALAFGLGTAFCDLPAIFFLPLLRV